MTMARPNARAVAPTTDRINSPSRKWRCQSSGRVIVSFVCIIQSRCSCAIIRAPPHRDLAGGPGESCNSGGLHGLVGDIMLGLLRQPCCALLSSQVRAELTGGPGSGSVASSRTSLRSFQEGGSVATKSVVKKVKELTDQ